VCSNSANYVSNLTINAEDLIRLRQPMSAPMGLFHGVVLFMFPVFHVFHVPVFMRNPWVPRFR
jgi:hypothetical protein